MTLALRFQRRHIPDDAAACIGRLAQTNREDIFRDAELLDGTRQRKTSWRDNTHLAFHVHKRLLVKCLGVDSG